MVVLNRLIKKLNDILFFLAHSNLYLGLGAASIILFLARVFSVQFKWQPASIAFSETFFLYSLNRLTDIKEDVVNYPERVAFFRKYGGRIMYAGASAYLFSLVIAYLNGILALVFTLAPFIVVFLYSVLRFKRFFIAKDIFVALGWTTIVLLFWTYYGISFLAILPAAAFFFLRVLFTTIMFDIKDVKGDRICGIATLPARNGVRATKLVLYSINLLCLGIIYFIVEAHDLSLALYVFLAPVAYSTAYLALFQKLGKKAGFYDIMVDGEYVLLGVLALLCWVIVQ